MALDIAQNMFPPPRHAHLQHWSHHHLQWCPLPALLFFAPSLAHFFESKHTQHIHPAGLGVFSHPWTEKCRQAKERTCSVDGHMNLLWFVLTYLLACSLARLLAHMLTHRGAQPGLHTKRKRWYIGTQHFPTHTYIHICLPNLFNLPRMTSNKTYNNHKHIGWQCHGSNAVLLFCWYGSMTWSWSLGNHLAHFCLTKSLGLTFRFHFGLHFGSHLGLTLVYTRSSSWVLTWHTFIISLWVSLLGLTFGSHFGSRFRTHWKLNRWLARGLTRGFAIRPWKSSPRVSLQCSERTPNIPWWVSKSDNYSKKSLIKRMLRTYVPEVM